MKLFGKTREQIDQEEYEAGVERCRRSRLDAYRNESDPLFFDWQKEDSTKEKWMAKIAEIKSRYPKPVATK